MNRYGKRFVLDLSKFRVIFLTAGSPNPNFPDSEAKQDLVEFYDRFYDERYGFGPDGQFVTRYYVETLLEDAEDHLGMGLKLDCGIPAWTVSGNEMDLVRDWMQSLKNNA